MKLVKSPYAKLASFNHAEHAARLDELHQQAQAARRVEVALGLYCFELKEIHLQHGQFGRWLAENRPQLARKSGEGYWQPSGSLETAMFLAKSALEVCGYQIADFIDVLQKSLPCAQGRCDAGQLLLLPEQKLPDEFKGLRDGIFALVDGKSQRQLRAEFKQIEDGQTKRGRLKGSSGLTKEQRENHATRTEQGRLTELEQAILERINWLLEIADAKNLGAMESTLIRKFCEAADTASGFGKRVLAARKVLTTDGHR